METPRSSQRAEESQAGGAQAVVRRGKCSHLPGRGSFPGRAAGALGRVGRRVHVPEDGTAPRERAGEGSAGFLQELGEKS